MTLNGTPLSLFDALPPRCEYYPVLIPDQNGQEEISALYEVMVNQVGVKQSQLTKMPHISIDGVTCPENDEKVLESIKAFLVTQNPILIDFTGVSYFPGRGGITLTLGIQNPVPVLEFNKLFMSAIQGKITKLKLHLTLARYVNSEHFERMKQPDIIYPKSCICQSVAVLKKRVGEKGAYVNIGVIQFGL